MTAAHGSDRDGAGIKPGALAWIDSVIAGLPFNAPKQAIEQTRLPTTVTVETVTAPIERDIADVAINELADGGVGGGVGNDLNIAIDNADVVNGGNGNDETVAEIAELPLPEANRGGAGNDIFPRPKSRKGFSKELRRVWDWLDAHANEITHEDPVQRVVAEATDVSHPTAGKALKRWRDHNGITKPDYYHEQAS